MKFIASEQLVPHFKSLVKVGGYILIKAKCAKKRAFSSKKHFFQIKKGGLKNGSTAIILGLKWSQCQVEQEKMVGFLYSKNLGFQWPLELHPKKSLKKQFFGCNSFLSFLRNCKNLKRSKQIVLSFLTFFV